jgi:hypothetical protein
LPYFRANRRLPWSPHPFGGLPHGREAGSMTVASELTR